MIMYLAYMYMEILSLSQGDIATCTSYSIFLWSANGRGITEKHLQHQNDIAITSCLFYQVCRVLQLARQNENDINVNHKGEGVRESSVRYIHHRT
jgi:hypothetical protein